ncbi:hypothetical protein EJ997_11290 [Flaviflexus ciconiae]|uniref:Uncharacterized protein n=1 Tax=Flaviflexus ciconiae TaxID=2496867 RepID=A0A3Q9G538_9ACTO|nr:hypothetical protein [Flaviflexus ciconiae]AZQ77838.1 hypothetical protein EJ997_11290 [Flaviflexus ciconiae]
MNKTATIGVIATATALTLAACSGDEADNDATTTEQQPDAPTAEPSEGPTDTAEETTEEATETPSEEPSDAPSEEPTEDPSAPVEQTALPVPVDASIDTPPQNEIPATIKWLEPGESLHVYVNGSSTPGCFVEPIEAWTDGEAIDIAFSPTEDDVACTADIVTHAWEITWDSPYEVTGEMPLTLTDILGEDESIDTILPLAPVTDLTSE